MISNYLEATEGEKQQSICWYNYETFCSKKLKDSSAVCVFDREEKPKTGLRQWQHINELETYII